jgi:hypothetical protein
MLKFVPYTRGLTWSEWAARQKSSFVAHMQRFGNMVASFWQDETTGDISTSLGPTWADTVRADVEDVALSNMRWSMHGGDNAAALRLFNEGGTISPGKKMWIPLSGTDAAGIRAGAFPGGLSGSRRDAPRRDGGPPLLFSKADGQPKYFGIDSVNVKKRLNLEDDRNATIANMQAFFRDTK